MSTGTIDREHRTNLWRCGIIGCAPSRSRRGYPGGPHHRVLIGSDITGSHFAKNPETSMLNAAVREKTCASPSSRTRSCRLGTDLWGLSRKFPRCPHTISAADGSLSAFDVSNVPSAPGRRGDYPGDRFERWPSGKPRRRRSGSPETRNALEDSERLLSAQCVAHGLPRVPQVRRVEIACSSTSAWRSRTVVQEVRSL